MQINAQFLLPQPLGKASSPKFAGLTLTGASVSALTFGATANARIGVSADTTVGVLTFTSPSAGSFAFSGGGVDLTSNTKLTGGSASYYYLPWNTGTNTSDLSAVSGVRLLHNGNIALATTGLSGFTGGAGNMTIVSGTGNSRTMALQTTTSGGTATTFLTGNADQSATFGAGVTIPGTNTLKFGATAQASIGVSADTTAGNLDFTPPATGLVRNASTEYSFVTDSNSNKFRFRVSGDQYLSLSGTDGAGGTGLISAVNGGGFVVGSPRLIWGAANGTVAGDGAHVNNGFVKAVTAIANAAATAVLTVTIPNAPHSGILRVRLGASLGAGGAIGANEATAGITYDIAFARTAGVNAVAAIAAASGSTGSAAVAGAATCTVTAAVSVVSGAVGASNSFTINATISRGSGASTNHTCVVQAEILNANATGINIQ